MSGSGRFRALRPLDESTALQANEVDAVREGSASSVSLSPILPSSSSAPVRTQNRTLSACLRCRRSKAKVRNICLLRQYLHKLLFGRREISNVLSRGYPEEPLNLSDSHHGSRSKDRTFHARHASPTVSSRQWKQRGQKWPTSPFQASPVNLIEC